MPNDEEYLTAVLWNSTAYAWKFKEGRDGFL